MKLSDLVEAYAPDDLVQCITCKGHGTQLFTPQHGDNFEEPCDMCKGVGKVKYSKLVAARGVPKAKP